MKDEEIIEILKRKNYYAKKEVSARMKVAEEWSKLSNVPQNKIFELSNDLEDTTISVEQNKQELIKDLTDKRHDKLLTQKQMSELVNIDRRTIERMECKYACNLDTIVTIANKLGYRLVLEEM